MTIERDWFTTEEAAKELGVTPSTIRGAAFRGVLKVEIVAPRVRAITRAELERYRRENRGTHGREVTRARAAAERAAAERAAAAKTALDAT